MFILLARVMAFIRTRVVSIALVKLLAIVCTIVSAEGFVLGMVAFTVIVLVTITVKSLVALFYTYGFGDNRNYDCSFCYTNILVLSKIEIIISYEARVIFLSFVSSLNWIHS